MWSGFMWQRIATLAGSCELSYEPVGSSNCKQLFNELLLDSDEEVCSLKLISDTSKQLQVLMRGKILWITLKYC